MSGRFCLPLLWLHEVAPQLWPHGVEGRLWLRPPPWRPLAADWRGPPWLCPQHASPRSHWDSHGSTLGSPLHFPWVSPGLATCSILFCWPFKIKDRWSKVRFQQTHNQCFVKAVLKGVQIGTPTWQVSLILYSSVSNTWGESRALEDCCVSSKKPLKGLRRRQGSYW